MANLGEFIGALEAHRRNGGKPDTGEPINPRRGRDLLVIALAAVLILGSAIALFALVLNR